MKWDKFFRYLIFTPALLFALPGTSAAQLALFPLGARAAGIANITTVETDVWSAVNNQASLGMLSDYGVGVLYEQRFVMEEMGVSSMVGTFPLLGNGVGVSLSNMGISSYGQNRFGLSVGRKLSQFIALGVGVDAHLMRFSGEYKNLFAVTGDIAVWACPVTNLTLGLHIFNVTFSTWSNSEKSAMPVVFSLGACYSIAVPVALYGEIAKDVNEAARVKFGTEFTPVKALFLRVGVIAEPFETHFGVGCAYKKMQFDIAFNRHPVLGYSPQAGVTVKL